jgi:hypothetical protein
MKDIPENFDNIVNMLNSIDKRDASLGIGLLTTYINQNIAGFIGITGNCQSVRLRKLHQKITSRLDTSLWFPRRDFNSKWVL